jgi:hypothetical protein
MSIEEPKKEGMTREEMITWFDTDHIPPEDWATIRASNRNYMETTYELVSPQGASNIYPDDIEDQGNLEG